MPKAHLYYFVVWTSKDLIFELIEPNDTHYTHYQNVEFSYTFSNYLFPLNVKKVLLEESEIEKGQDGIDHYSIQCDQCMCCAGIILNVRPCSLKMLRF